MNQTKRRRGNPGTHGDSRHGEYYHLYRVWVGMKSRCYWKKDTAYARYGGRGIRVCDEWQTWEPFKEWSLAHGYQDG